MRGLQAALLLLVAGVVLPGCSGEGAGAGVGDALGEVDEGADAGADDDSESDSAPFMIVVEHIVHPAGTAWHCAGSLVSRRTGLTSAECARGPAGAGDLWALAAATAAGLVPRDEGARRVSRVATAGPALQTASDLDDERWSAAHDLAVLELVAPFGSSTHARPILMATSPQECSLSGMCHVVRATWRAVEGGSGGGAGAGETRARLRIVDAAVAPDAQCAGAVHQWTALSERAMCVSGPELCAAERGAGVVCGGKLCGVVSRSGPLRAPPAPCPTAHAAQSVARWRRFLHCAHTLRACGRGACAELCSERRLQDGEEGQGPAPAAAAPAGRRPPARPTPTPTPRAGGVSNKETQRPTRVQAYLYPAWEAGGDGGEREVEREGERLARLRAGAGNRRGDAGGAGGGQPAQQAQPELPELKPPGGVEPGPDTNVDPASASIIEATDGATQSMGGAEPAPARSSPTRTRRPTDSPRPRTGLRARPLPARPARPRQPTSGAATAMPAPHTPLFEPNRPDFRVGEYGDNALEYAADEGGGDGGVGGGGGGGGGSGGGGQSSPATEPASTLVATAGAGGGKSKSHARPQAGLGLDAGPAPQHNRKRPTTRKRMSVPNPQKKKLVSVTKKEKLTKGAIDRSFTFTSSLFLLLAILLL